MVLGPHRGGLDSTRALGGTALAVVTNAACPCLVVRRPLRLPLREVVVPIDVSDTARGALLVGLSWASALRLNSPAGGHSGATLTALHVTTSENRGATSPAIERAVADVRDAAGTWAGVSIRTEAVTDTDVAHGIASYVVTHAPDLVAMGTRGLGIDRLGRLGSIAAAVTARIETPVLLVPPAMWMAYSQAREA
jgi:nucleotide-binding universal stress UspA family protein